ncbi:hypothetical protein TSAR_007140 [Trichomalopsis sarcophagae]|uniref:Uncharacterized protein n=1 Tax=Trichomalopsis sarcophagae TaxID=543379 RepID=A0A232EEF2_9HYME|nr:hypothetical protein TSAR_007140 [Trichomalopsis sarcophagae]
MPVPGLNCTRMRKKLKELLLLGFQRRNYAYFSTDSGFHFYRVSKERARSYRPFATRVVFDLIKSVVNILSITCIRCIKINQTNMNAASKMVHTIVYDIQFQKIAFIVPRVMGLDRRDREVCM